MLEMARRILVSAGFFCLLTLIAGDGGLSNNATPNSSNTTSESWLGKPDRETSYLSMHQLNKESRRIVGELETAMAKLKAQTGCGSENAGDQRCDAEAAKGSSAGEEQQLLKTLEGARRMVKTLNTRLQVEMLDDDYDGQDGDDVQDPIHYPEPVHGYQPAPVAWEGLPETPIEAMGSVGSSFILRRLTEMVMSTKHMKELLIDYHNSTEWPNMTTAGYPPVKQYPWSSKTNQEAVAALAVHARGTPRRLGADVAQMVKHRLKMWGVAVVHDVVSREQVDAVRAWLLEEVMDPANTDKFGSIHAKKYRKDLPLDLSKSPLATKLFKDVVETLKPISEAILGDNPTLVELSSLTSLPRSHKQIAHPDSDMAGIKAFESSLVMSNFLALGDVGDNQAALDTWPGSHTFFHFLGEHNRKAILKMVSPVRMSVKAGSVVLMDSRLMHRGTSNNSTQARPVIYWSFRNTTAKPPTGPTYTILPKYKSNKFRLNEILEGHMEHIPVQIAMGSDPGNGTSNQEEPLADDDDDTEEADKARAAAASKGTDDDNDDSDDSN